MRRPGIDGGFMFCFFLNLLFSSFWALPAVALFVAHFIVGTPLWLGWAALGIWIVIEFAITAFLSWAVSSSTSETAETGVRGKTTIRYSSQRRTPPSEDK